MKQREGRWWGEELAERDPGADRLQGLGREGHGEPLFNGYRISVLQDERVLVMNSADGGTTMYLMPLNCTHKKRLKQ